MHFCSLYQAFSRPLETPKSGQIPENLQAATNLIFDENATWDLETSEVGKIEKKKEEKGKSWWEETNFSRWKWTRKQFTFFIFPNIYMHFVKDNKKTIDQIPMNRAAWDCQCCFACWSLSAFSVLRRSSQYSGQLIQRVAKLEAQQDVDISELKLCVSLYLLFNRMCSSSKFTADSYTPTCHQSIYQCLFGERVFKIQNSRERVRITHV